MFALCSYTRQALDSAARPIQAVNMCNEYLRDKTPEQLAMQFSEQRIPVRFPEGVPNLPAEQSVKITDRAPIVRVGPEGAELVMRRWSWPAPGGKPVYNFRSEGRRFGPERCLIVAEFTDQPPEEGAPKRRPKSKWLFTMPDAPFFCIAGIWRAYAEVGEAFTMLVDLQFAADGVCAKLRSWTFIDPSHPRMNLAMKTVSERLSDAIPAFPGAVGALWLSGDRDREREAQAAAAALLAEALAPLEILSETALFHFGMQEVRFPQIDAPVHALQPRWP